jgi:hypothetical protein
MNSTNPHIIIFSHGFGVRKDAKGLFTAIARAVPDAENILFHYNPINDKSNTLTAKTLPEQVQKLRKVINTARAEYPGAVIDLVCHAQGCVVAGILKPRGIRKVIMLTPPDKMSQATLIEQLESRAEITIDPNVKTRVPLSDGGTIVVHPEYWQSLDGVEPVKLYNRLAKFTALRIINARNDDVLGPVSFEGIDPNISFVTLDGDHNFEEEESRARILHILQKELAL